MSGNAKSDVPTSMEEGRDGGLAIAETVGDSASSSSSVMMTISEKASPMSTTTGGVSTPTSRVQKLLLKYFSGGTLVDAILLEASQQIGQSVLTLPWIFANMGYTAGIICLILFSVSSMWTQSLLMTLLAEFRHQKKKNEKKTDDKSVAIKTMNPQDISTRSQAVITTDLHENDVSDDDDDVDIDSDHRHQSDVNDHIASYHDVITYLVGPWWGGFSWLVVVVALIGLSTVQIISTSSNLYLLEPEEGGYGKRDLSLIVGAVFAITAFIPTFRDYRILAVVGIIATAYTAYFMTITSTLIGPSEDTVYGAPTDIRGFFTSFASLLFMFGGHTAAVEKADVMNDHSRYDIAFAYSVLYVYTITLPNGITAYHTFGLEAQEHSNSFYLFEPSVARDIGIGLMCIHEFVAFGLFCGPLYHMVEKALNIDHKGYILRTSSRLFVVGFMLLLAVAFPFFGVINGLLGAFTTTFGTFIIPCAVYNLYYFTRDAEEQQKRISAIPKSFPVPVSMATIRIVNWVLIVGTAVFGLGFGGWASAMTFVDNLGNMGQGVFDPCYEC